MICFFFKFFYFFYFLFFYFLFFLLLFSLFQTKKEQRLKFCEFVEENATKSNELIKNREYAIWEEQVRKFSNISLFSILENFLYKKFFCKVPFFHSVIDFSWRLTFKNKKAIDALDNIINKNSCFKEKNDLLALISFVRQPSKLNNHTPSWVDFWLEAEKDLPKASFEFLKLHRSTILEEFQRSLKHLGQFSLPDELWTINSMPFPFHFFSILQQFLDGILLDAAYDESKINFVLMMTMVPDAREKAALESVLQDPAKSDWTLKVLEDFDNFLTIGCQEEQPLNWDECMDFAQKHLTANSFKLLKKYEAELFAQFQYDQDLHFRSENSHRSDSLDDE